MVPSGNVALPSFTVTIFTPSMPWPPSSTPLKRITSDYHYHTVSADSEAVLDGIEESLRVRGFLILKV